MSRQYKPGDIVRVTSKKSAHYGDKGFFIRYCDDRDPGVCTVLICNGRAVSISTKNIELFAVRNRDVDYDECTRFIKRNVHIYGSAQTGSIRKLCDGEVPGYCYGITNIVTAFIDYIRFTYKDVSIQTELTVSWDELFGYS